MRTRILAVNMWRCIIFVSLQWAACVIAADDGASHGSEGHLQSGGFGRSIRGNATTGSMRGSRFLVGYDSTPISGTWENPGDAASGAGPFLYGGSVYSATARHAFVDANGDVVVTVRMTLLFSSACYGLAKFVVANNSWVCMNVPLPTVQSNVVPGSVTTALQWGGAYYLLGLNNVWNWGNCYQLPCSPSACTWLGWHGMWTLPSGASSVVGSWNTSE